MNITKQRLEELIFIEKLPYLKIGKIYGCSDANVKKVARKLGIELKPRRRVNSKETFNKGVSNRSNILCNYCNNKIESKGAVKYCSKDCFNKHTKDNTYIKFLSSPKEYQRASYSIPDSIKINILLEQNGKCSICDINNIWNDKILVFVLDHINGDASNNTRENLRCICPNCDSQLDTYKSKNKNSARKDRYLKNKK